MSDLSVGPTFAGCRLEAVAGRGGMGVVYRATQLALNRRVAVKAIAPSLAEQMAFRERFQHESQLTASIDHPNVIPIYEAGDAAGTLYLIMRWVDGTDLRRLLDDTGRLPPARTVALLRPIASALAAAHRRGLVHRDIKPGNVLIAHADEGEAEHPYLTDFGIARRTGTRRDLTRTGVLVGTLDYTAPERLEGGKGTPASDIYAFGCMLYETLTGSVPFDRPTETERMNAHVSDPIPAARASDPTVPEQLGAVIARSLAKDPSDRFASAGELATALDRVLAHVHAAPAPEPKTTTAAAGTPRQRRLWPAVAASVAALVIAGVVVAILSTGGGGGSNGLTAHAPLTLDGAVGSMAGDYNGTVWVSVPSKGELQELTPTGRMIFPIGGRPGALAAVPGGVWVAGGGRLTEFGVDGERIAGTDQPSTATLVAASRKHGTVFTADSTGAVRRLGSNVVARVPPAPNAIASGEGWLWVALADGRLERISATLTAERAIDGTSPTPFVWAISFATGRLYQLSYDKRRVIASLHLASPPLALAAATPTTVWVATENNQLIKVTSAAG